MAAIIHAPALSGSGRQLRRPGAVGASAPVAVAAEALSSLATAPAAMMAAAPAEPVEAVSPAAAVPALPVEPAPFAPREEQLEQQARQLQADAQQLRQDREALDAATASLARQQAGLDERERQLASARQKLADEADEIKAQAELRGHAAGTEQGERAAGEAVAAQVARVGALAQALTQAKRALLEENQDMLVDIAFAATCRMLGRHAATRAGIESIVLGLIENERDVETLTVRLHPDDARLLGDAVAPLGPRVAVQADASVELGGCLVDSGRGTLDARLERQLQHLREALTVVRGERNTFEVPV